MQVTEAGLFEMLGRLYAEVRTLHAENESLRSAVAHQRAQEPATLAPPSSQTRSKRSTEAPGG